MALPDGTALEVGAAEPPLRLRSLDVVVAALGLIALAVLLPPMAALFAGAFWLLVVVVVRSDLDRYLIPDAASLGIAATGLAQAWWAGWAGVGGGVGAGGWEAVASALAQGLGAGAAVYAVRTGYRWLRGQEGIGFGDVKLAAALGLWLDPFAQALALQLAAMAALGVVLTARALERRSQGPAEDGARVEDGAGVEDGPESPHGMTMVPFGAFLAPAGFAVHVWAQAVPDGWGGWP
ncbi:hypothetical protein C2U72_16485 [Prosthecomicrobium hirschii]|uniref:prepilin peptidase n=1 Tax=Prosthecodimorpha hirschii TaxID=665126 RepID=UPI00112EEF29|nr:prepilin peptidase [Prosthecomicrobium hirschii]TPQ49843.1 hypothetical protein C2U72_16485 [Prosthecomicrobium hirschii]